MTRLTLMTLRSRPVDEFSGVHAAQKLTALRFRYAQNGLLRMRTVGQPSNPIKTQTIDQ